MAKVAGINWNYFRSEVVKYLKNLEVSKAVVGSEKKLQSHLYKKLEVKFPIIDKEYTLQSSNGVKMDIDLGRGEVGIEIKLAKSLLKSAAQRQRLIGQVGEYTNTYKSDIIVLVVGSKSDEKSPLLKEVKKNIKKFDAYYLYKSVV